MIQEQPVQKSAAREGTAEFLQQREAAVELLMQTAEVWFGQPEDAATDRHLFKVWCAAMARYFALLHVTVDNQVQRNKQFDHSIVLMHESFALYARASDRMVAEDVKAAVENRVQ